MIISVYVDETTVARMHQIASELGRTIEDLADTAVSEAALTFFRGRNDDPARSAEAPTGARRPSGAPPEGQRAVASDAAREAGR